MAKVVDAGWVEVRHAIAVHIHPDLDDPRELHQVGGSLDRGVAVAGDPSWGESEGTLGWSDLAVAVGVDPAATRRHRDPVARATDEGQGSERAEPVTHRIDGDRGDTVSRHLGRHEKQSELFVTQTTVAEDRHWPPARGRRSGRQDQIKEHLAHGLNPWRVSRTTASGLAIATAHGDRFLEILASARLGLAYLNLGDYRRTIDVVRQYTGALSGDLARERFEMAALPAVSGRQYRVSSLSSLGDFGEASAAAEEAFEIATTVDHPYSVALALYMAGRWRARQGNFAEAIPWLERSLEAFRREGYYYFSAAASFTGGV